MARTLTVNKGGGGTDYTPGWKELVISRAAYGEYNGAKYMDVWFEGYPDNLNTRIYEKVGTDGEEWAIGQVFRFANAGITGALAGPDGNLVIKMDDDATQLKGRMVNGFFYKVGKYSRVLKQFAPTVFKNAAEEFTHEDVEYWKTKAMKFYTEYVQPKLTNVEDNGEVPPQERDSAMPY